MGNPLVIIIYLDVKYHVHIGVFISRTNFYFFCLVGCNVVNFLKCYTNIFHIFCNDFIQISVHDCVSILHAYFNLLGSRTPNLCDVRQYLDFTQEIILPLFHKVSSTHQLKTGSSLISFSTTYSAISTGLDCLRSFSGTQ